MRVKRDNERAAKEQLEGVSGTALRYITGSLDNIIQARAVAFAAAAGYHRDFYKKQKGISVKMSLTRDRRRSIPAKEVSFKHINIPAMDVSTFIEKLKHERLKQKLSLDVLALMSGVSRSTISRYEGGRSHRATPEHLCKIADALGVKHTLEDHCCVAEFRNEVKSLIEKLIAERKRKEIPMKVMAAGAGIAFSTWWRYEKGQTNSVDMRIINSVANYLGVSFDVATDKLIQHR